MKLYQFVYACKCGTRATITKEVEDITITLEDQSLWFNECPSCHKDVDIHYVTEAVHMA